MKNPYPTEHLDPTADDGTMPESVDILRTNVVGRRIVNAEHRPSDEAGSYSWGLPRPTTTFVITLDNGTEVEMFESSDCCAYTELESFWRDPASVDHIIMGVGTTDDYETWHIYADAGDMLQLKVGWSAGNPFYYGYGFYIRVKKTASTS